MDGRFPEICSLLNKLPEEQKGEHLSQAATPWSVLHGETQRELGLCCHGWTKLPGARHHQWSALDFKHSYHSCVGVNLASLRAFDRLC